MINLSRHIEVLLLTHDCVVVPDFGGFVVQYVPAHYVSEEQLLVPPHRTVSFNAQLTWDDGLIVQSCMQTAGCSYPEAVRLVKRAVEELKQTLSSTKTLNFEGIGQLNIGETGLCEFVPSEAGVASPTLYALEVLSCPIYHALGGHVAQQSADAEKSVRESAETLTPVTQTADAEGDERRAKRSYTLSINRELCNYVAAAVVAIVFYFLWVTPIGVVGNDSAAQRAQVFPARTVSKASPQVAAQQTTKAAAPQSTNAKSDDKSDAAAETGSEADSKAAEAVKVEADKRFTIILVSSVKRSNAETYVETLHKDGFAEAEVMAKPRMVRVTYGHYATEAEAYDTLRKMRKDKRFADAWVMNVRE